MDFAVHLSARVWLLGGQKYAHCWCNLQTSFCKY